MQYCLQWMLRTIERHYGKVYFKKEIDDKLKESYDNGYSNAYCYGVHKGLYIAVKAIRDEIASYNGLSKQEWIDKVWYMINNAKYKSTGEKIL